MTSYFRQNIFYKKATATFRYSRCWVYSLIYPGGQAQLKSDVALIKETGVFDADSYRNSYPWAKDAKVDPVEHFLIVGWKKKYKPSQYFDTGFYLLQVKDRGDKLNVNPLVHYLKSGWRQGYDPHPQFDTNYYLQENVDVRVNGENPLVHFIMWGKAENRKPHPKAIGFARDYRDWIRENTLSVRSLLDQRQSQAKWDYRPLISFITPVFHPDMDIFQAMLDSVFAQTYDNWELCIANGSIGNQEIANLLVWAEAKDSRIKVKHLSENHGIAANSNEAISLAKGEFVAILDHDDLLAPNMLYEVVSRLNETPEADIIYFDEDKYDSFRGGRVEPNFKPDWSPEMLLSTNYLMHSVLRLSLVRQVGCFDPAYDGTQDWDLALRCVEYTNSVEHISKILYHWRITEGSAAGNYNAKPHVFEAQERAVKNHLVRRGIKNPHVKYVRHAVLRSKWEPNFPSVSVIIPTKDNTEHLKRCIHSVANTNYPDLEIILVDGGSTYAETIEYYARLGELSIQVKIVDYFDTAFNFGRALNLGANHASGEMLLFLNNDVETYDSDDWLEELVRWAEMPNIGVVGAKLLYPNQTIQHAGVVLGMSGHADHIFSGFAVDQGSYFGLTSWYRNFSAVTGACQMVRRSIFEEVGKYSERYQIAFSDIEFCRRVVDAGYRVVFTPFAALTHYEGVSRGKHIPENDIQVGFDQFYAWIEKGDPYYNRNLSLLGCEPGLRFDDEISSVERLALIAQR